MPDEDGFGEDEFREPEPVVLPIEDHIDLHAFQPREVPELLDEYLRACREAGILEVRIIHGKGAGRLRARVESLLKKNPAVRSFRIAPPERGAWGATVAWLFPLDTPSGDRT